MPRHVLFNAETRWKERRMIVAALVQALVLTDLA